MKDVSPIGSLTLFLAQKRAEGVKPSSLQWFRYCTERFIREAPAPADVRKLTPAHLVTWTEVMRERGLKPGGIRSYQSAVWRWLRWLNEMGYHKEDLSRKVKLVRVREEDITRRTATPEIRAKLVRCALARSEHTYRNAALVEFLWSTGMRRSEVAALQLADVDLDAGEVYVGKTKTGKPRRIGIDMQAVVALHAYLIHERGKEPGPLFMARMKRGMSTDAMRCVIRSLADSAGVEVSAHDFRRACAARLLEGDAPLDTVMHQLGHETPTMSLIYGAEGRADRSIRAYHKVAAG